MTPIDLLSWPEIHDAEQAVVAAEAARLSAARRYQLAPSGDRGQRRRALEEATGAVLRAAVELQRRRRAFEA